MTTRPASAFAPTISVRRARRPRSRALPTALRQVHREASTKISASAQDNAIHNREKVEWVQNENVTAVVMIMLTPSSNRRNSSAAFRRCTE